MKGTTCMIVAVCGNGYCGSGALYDLLQESKDLSVCSKDIEFTFLYDVDGLDDLRYHITEKPVRFFSSDAAIKRYREYIKQLCSPNSSINKLMGKELKAITKDYTESITQLSWNGWWQYDVIHAGSWTRNTEFRIKPRINNILSKTGLKPLDIMKGSKMYLSVNPPSFDVITRKYVDKLVSLFNTEQREKVVLDKPFPVGMRDRYEKYFSDEIKAIYLTRDPRDLYLAAKNVYGTYSSWIATDNVDQFIKYYKILYSDIHCVTEDENNIIVPFEDLIYCYGKTCERISAFLGIDCRFTKEYFDPDKSIANTQLFYKMNNHTQDVLKIEKELADYLYSFPEGIACNTGKRMF